AHLGSLLRCLPLRAPSAELHALPRRSDGALVTDRLWLGTVAGLFAGLVAAAAIVLYLGISQRERVASLHGIADEPLFLAALGGLVLMALQALRWWVVMRPVLELNYGQAFRALMVGFFFNVLLPARGGDLLRVQYLGKRTGTSRAKLLGTEIVDFWSDKWGWVAAFPILCLFGSPPSWLFRALLLIGSIVVGVGVLLALMGSGLVRRGPRWLTNLRDGFAANRWKRLLLVETVIAPLPWLWETVLIAVAHDAETHQVRHAGVGVSPLEARPELGGGIDLLLAPLADGSAGLQDHGVLDDEEVPLLVADAALLGLGAPDVLDRVPLES